MLVSSSRSLREIIENDDELSRSEDVQHRMVPDMEAEAQYLWLKEKIREEEERFENSRRGREVAEDMGEGFLKEQHDAMANGLPGEDADPRRITNMARLPGMEGLAEIVADEEPHAVMLTGEEVLEQQLLSPVDYLCTKVEKRGTAHKAMVDALSASMKRAYETPPHHRVIDGAVQLLEFDGKYVLVDGLHRTYIAHTTWPNVKLLCNITKLRAFHGEGTYFSYVVPMANLINCDSRAMCREMQMAAFVATLYTKYLSTIMETGHLLAHHEMEKWAHSYFGAQRRDLTMNRHYLGGIVELMNARLRSHGMGIEVPRKVGDTNSKIIEFKDKTYEDGSPGLAEEFTAYALDSLKHRPNTGEAIVDGVAATPMGLAVLLIPDESIPYTATLKDVIEDGIPTSGVTSRIQ